MYKLPRVSVIMAEFNTDAAYLDAAIQSILSQTFEDFEFIIIDDGSFNDVDKFVQKYGDDRIKVFRNEKNMGLVYSLNKAILHSQTDYLVRMDGDDVSLPNRIEILYKYICKHPEFDVVGTKAMEFYDDTDTGVIGKPGVKYPRSIMRGDIVIHASTIMKKSALLDVGLYKDYKRAEDLVLWCELLLGGHNLVTIDETLYWYRVNPGDYQKRKLKYRGGEIKARLTYYPKLGANLIDYAFILKSIVSGILPTRFVQNYRNKFVVTSMHTEVGGN